MLLKEWKTKPFNSGLYLLGQQDLDEFNGIRMWHDKDIPKQDKLVCVYNTETDRVSDKSVYVDVDGREYIKNKNEKCYLDEFKYINNHSKLYCYSKPSVMEGHRYSDDVAICYADSIEESIRIFSKLYNLSLLVGNVREVKFNDLGIFIATDY